MRRRKHLTERDCEELAQSKEGLCSLTQPFFQWKTSRDVHTGLYPCSRTSRLFRGKTSDNSFKRLYEYKTTDWGSLRSAGSNHHIPEMEEELFCSHMDEYDADFDHEADSCPSTSTLSRKRPFSSVESQNLNLNVHPSGEEVISSSNNCFDDDDDDYEMSTLVDLHPCYGLLGVTGQKEPFFEQINQFPDELLQCIFGFLPIVDLYKNVSLVCQKWKSLVSDTLFIPWKKRYHRYLQKEEQTVMEVEDILKRNGITSDNPLCILNLVKCFATLMSSPVKDLSIILDCLKNHHLYEMAESCVLHRMPDLRSNTEMVNAWAVLAVIMLLSSEVSDFQELIRCLQHSKSNLSLVDIMEAFYCLATILFALREQNILISNRIHYNLFYSLYLLENNSSQKKTVSTNDRNKPTFNITNEQQQIINHDIKCGQIVKIMAFAGTGKTSTLIKYAEKRPGLRFLYATFNKSIAEHAKNLFPKNVTCKTFHSLAYQKTGKLYQQRNKLNPSKLTSFCVNFVLPEGQAGFIRAKLVVKTLETFFSSADATIERDHVPIWCKNSHGERVMVTPEEQQFTVREADKIWERMKRLEKTQEYAYRMTHDGYLKLWQLQNPKLDSYDAIFVDEAQDCTPSIMQVVLSQNCGKIFVGDPHQQIYTFRGAVNALCEVPHTHIFYLTQSFRFGAEIAYIGATILDTCKKIRHKALVGTNQEDTVRECTQTKVAILSRSNACVFEQAVSVIDGENTPRIHIIGGPKNFGLFKIYDIWILQNMDYKRKMIKDKFIATWIKKGGFSALKNYAVSSEDRELEGKIAIVEKYNQRIPDLVKRIEMCHTPDRAHADYVLGTVHKAKGMEFDSVKITDDFMKVACARHNLERLRIQMDRSVEDEWNLLYVAVTRAKRHLNITKSVENIVTLAGEYFLKAELTSKVLKDGPVSCALQHCQNAIPEQTVLTMRKLPITFSDKSEDKGGYICHACAQQRIGPITQLMLSPEILNSIVLKHENIVLSRRHEILMQAF